jgi:hypothetical protein
MRVVSLAVLVASTSLASAQPTAVPAAAPAAPPADVVTDRAATDEQNVAIGLAVNPPLRWADAAAVGFSGYIGFANQHAIRINLATYEHTANVIGDLGSIAAGGEGSEGIYSGRTTDLGIGYQHYTRGMFDGCSLEVGVLRRAQDLREEDDFASPSIVETKATGYAGRMMIGWSWLFAQRVFVATGVGVSVGRYAGTERTAGSTYMPQYTSKDFVRYETSGEVYLRLGLAFGL